MNMRKICANCKSGYIEGDRYCRFCGAPMGTPEFVEENFATIYGPPPVKRTHHCIKCGFTWETWEAKHQLSGAMTIGRNRPQTFSAARNCKAQR